MSFLACSLLYIDLIYLVISGFKTFSSASSSSSKKGASTSAETVLTPTSTPKSHLTIPHVLSNKYYTAPVHFALHAPVHGAIDAAVQKMKVARPPAVVFVWEHGAKLDRNEGLASSSYKWKDDAEDLARQMKGVKEWEPEVVLGVRVPLVSGESRDNNAEEGEDNGEIDNELMQLGFEYVDVSDRVVGPANVENQEEDEKEGELPFYCSTFYILTTCFLSLDIDIPGLPRVLDALSTIMWPSMISGKGKGRQESAEQEDMMHELLLSVSDMSGLGRKDTADGFFSPYDFGKKSSSLEVPGGKKERKQPWLDTNNLGGEDEGMLDSPGEIGGGLSPFGMGKGRILGKKVSMGFEDDFSEFISAPMEVEKSKIRGLGVDLEHLDLSQAGFDEMSEETPIQTAIAESVVTGDSLGLRSPSGVIHTESLSDFGDIPDEDIYEQLGEEEEEWEDAIEDVDDWDDLPSKEEIEETAGRIFGNTEFRRASDLDSVLDTLNGLKREIAEMSDEEEKHKMAAKVALGLVYGIK